MSKNPFVNCKSRKRRRVRPPINKPKEKLFCPRTMVRYDNSPNEYSTKWVCKICLKCILSEAGVVNHMAKTCSALAVQDIPSPPKKNEDTRYICEFCNKVFSRRVTLKKHLEEHEKSSSSVNSEQSDNEVDDTLITDNANGSKNKPKEKI